MLKIYKYFSWADKKLHAVFYIENKDDISEDLLSDFKDPDNEKKFVKPEGVQSKAGLIDKGKTLGPSVAQAQGVMIKSEGLVSEHDYLFGKKKDENNIIDVKSKHDFPTLDLGGDSSGGSIFGV